MPYLNSTAFLCLNISMSSALNPLGAAVAGIATLQGLNRPGGLAAPSAVISNIAIPGYPLVSFRDYFLVTMESWITSIPLRTQFIALFESFPETLTSQTIRTLEPVVGSNEWNIDRAVKVSTAAPLQDVIGCVFLNGANIPTDVVTAGSAPIENNRGFIQGSILENRDAFAANNLTLQFRETNLSFVDSIMRPWVILAAHKGFVARPPEDSIKTNIIIIQYAKTYQNVSQIPRKIWKYYNCVPLSVDTRNLSYDAETVESYDVPFLYDYYTVEDNLYIPLPDIISKIGKGNVPRISPLQR